jgi:hypothetical protein
MPAPDYATEIANLEAAVASGELTIEQDGERVTYRSMADLTAALSYFQRKANVGAAPASSRGAFGFSLTAYSRD